MKFVVALWVGVLGAWILAITGCATARSKLAYRADVDTFVAGHARNTAPIPAPTTLEPKPWRVGQWALYKRHVGSEASYDRLSVVALDSCGIWIEHVIQQDDGASKWTFCVRPTANPARDARVGELQIVITQLKWSEPEVFDFRDGQAAGAKPGFEWLVSQLAAPWRGNFGLAREDVDVPAGHVAQAVRHRSNHRGVSVTSWSHPEVPFDGTVKTLGEGRVVELLAYGDHGAASVLSGLALELAAAVEPTPQEPSRIFFGLGYGLGWFSDTERTASTVSGQLGVRLAPRLDLLTYGGAIILERYAPDPILSQSAGLGLLGVRWSPFRPLRYQPQRFPGGSALYVQAGLGYAALSRGAAEETTVAHGLAVGAAIGWIGIQARDWVGGVELSDSVLFFNAGEGTRHSLALKMFYQLYLPWP